jgi:hypothetical protein
VNECNRRDAQIHGPDPDSLLPKGIEPGCRIVVEGAILAWEKSLKILCNLA